MRYHVVSLAVFVRVYLLVRGGRRSRQGDVMVAMWVAFDDGVLVVVHVHVCFP